MIDFNANMKLVYFVYEKHFKNYNHIKDDLCQEGFIALWRCCNYFKPDSEFQFSSYATKAIKNAMTCYAVRKEHRHFNTTNFSELVDEEKKHLTEFEKYDFSDFENYINSNYIFVENFNNQTERNKQIVKMRFIDDKNQSEIAKEFQCSQSYISRIITKFKNQLKSQLLDL